MTIDEAIDGLKRIFSNYELDLPCTDSLNIESGIIMLLEELKDYRDKNKMVVRVDCENIDSVKDKIEELSKYAESQYSKGYSKATNDYYAKSEKDRQSYYDFGYEVGYAKAIDDFAELIRNRIEIGCMFTVAEIDRWKEQLKAGVGE